MLEIERDKRKIEGLGIQGYKQRFNDDFMEFKLSLSLHLRFFTTVNLFPTLQHYLYYLKKA